MFQDRLSTLNIQSIKSAKSRQTDFNEILDDFLMKKARTKPIELLLNSMIVAFYFLIRISIMTA